MYKELSWPYEISLKFLTNDLKGAGDKPGAATKKKPSN